MITANIIKKAIENKHKDDICVLECKNGPTYTAKELLIFDAWVTKKSWSHPLTTIYEIKVHRSDFLNDNKWMKYLRYCHEFYFVCPKDLISKEELPPEAGLYYISNNGTTLYCKKKAIYRQMPEADSVLMYILMFRAIIDRDKEDKKKYWTEWLNDQKLDYKFGRNVSNKIRTIISQKIEAVEHENSQLKREIQKFKNLEEAIKNLGFSENDINQWSFERKVIEKIKEVSGLESNERMTRDIEEIIEKLQSLLSTCKG